MKDNQLEKIKKNYMDVPIPNDLDFVVRKALKDGKKNMPQVKKFKRIRIVATSIVAASVIFTIAVNSSSAFAQTASKLPVVSSLVKVLTFNEYTINKDTYHANIKTPAIKELGNKELENKLNEKYLEENKKLYNNFVTDMKSVKKNGGGHLGVESGYEVKTDTDRILAIGRYVVNTVGSSSTVFMYDTIDKKDKILITLPSLFKNDKYVEIISENIKKQMIEQNKADSDKYYWVEGVEPDKNMQVFEHISKDQNFYINKNNKLVISFDKYEVAPGYMGVVEFIIPTEILSDILVSQAYLK